MHPELFTKALIGKVVDAGGQLRLARFSGLVTEGGRVTGVRLVDQGSAEEAVLPAEAVVLATGEGWTRKGQELGLALA